MRKVRHWMQIVLLLMTALSFGLPLGCNGREAKGMDKFIAGYRSARMKARKELLEQAYKQYGIKAGKEEVEAKAREQLKRVQGRETYTQADADAANRKISAQKELLSLWRTDPQKAEALYKAKYSTLFSAAEWEGMKKGYANDKSYQALMKAPLVSVETLLDGYRKIAEESIKSGKLERALKENKVISEDSRLENWINDQPQISKLDEGYQAYLASHPELAQKLIPQSMPEAKRESAATSASAGTGWRPAPTASGPQAARIPEYAAPGAKGKQP